ncbi:hypothetical protein BAK_2443 [Bacillus anthracis str. A0389]|nr:hypothetical protein BAMEG_2238 [Bacillus anthracis str. CDC 684]ACQ50660.1 hypothetical protein BAA_2420 [Bacillus anthracis str. A0248]EDS97295.1 hypothetical protein BAK_2443 [Bacillus anthracis str. A0389]EDT69562.1 hypothetical protein BAO_2356 [Bacillus anthracis str. A0174]
MYTSNKIKTSSQYRELVFIFTIVKIRIQGIQLNQVNSLHVFG